MVYRVLEYIKFAIAACDTWLRLVCPFLSIYSIWTRNAFDPGVLPLKTALHQRDEQTLTFASYLPNLLLTLYILFMLSN